MKICIVLLAFTFNLSAAHSQYTVGSVISKTKFLESCLNSAQKNTPALNAHAFCNCIFDLISQNFDSSNLSEIIQNIKGSKLSDTVLALTDAISKKAPNQLKTCLNTGATTEIKPWTKNEEDVFLASCIKGMEVNQVLIKNYDVQKCCQCILDNVKGKFSDKELIESSTNPAIMEITKNCLKLNKLQ